MNKRKTGLYKPDNSFFTAVIRDTQTLTIWIQVFLKELFFLKNIIQPGVVQYLFSSTLKVYFLASHYIIGNHLLRRTLVLCNIIEQ